MQWSWAVGLLGCMFAAACVWPASAWSGPVCDIPDDMMTQAAPLPNVAAALKRGTLDVLALGSGSTVGETGGAGGPGLAYHAPGASFPYRMAEALHDIRPSVRVDLTVRGGRSLTASDMLPRLRRELGRGHFDLVLWQTGTVEAVQGTRPDALRDDLLDGAAVAGRGHADLVLIDPQFSRFLRANVDVMPYESVLRQAAAMDGVTLFPRLDLTQGWASNGQVDLEHVGQADRDGIVTRLNACLGRALARFVLSGAKQR